MSGVIEKHGEYMDLIETSYNNGWYSPILGDLARIRRGASPRPIDSPLWFSDEGPGWVRISDITNANGRLTSTTQRLSPDGVSRSVPVYPGDVLMSICATIGEPVTVEIEACIHDGFVVFDKFAEKLDQRFLLHLLRSLTLDFKNHGQTGTQANLNTEIVKNTVVHIPLSIYEQSCIAAILDIFDAAIEKSEALIAKLKQVRTGMLHDLLTCGVDENGELRRENWQLVSLGELAEIASGVTLGRMVDGSDSVELPYLRVANVQDGFIDTSDVKTVRIFQSELQRYALAAGDVLMNEGGDFDKLGRGAVWDGRISPCLHQNHVFRVRCGSRLLPVFLALYSGSPAGKRYFVQASKQTTNLASINSTQLKAFPVLLPDITEQSKIVEQISEMDSLIGKETAGREKLRTIKSGLSADLLTGQVRVPPDLELI